MELGFDFLNLIFLDDEKIAVQLVRHVIMLVITDFRKVPEHPWEGIGAGADQMAYELIVGWIRFRQAKKRFRELPNVVVGLHVNVRFPCEKLPHVRWRAAF